MARPKSRILTRPSFVKKMFSGFRSRWTIPFSCAAARPVGDLEGVVDRLARRELPARERRAQRLALEQFLDDVGRALLRPDVVDGGDVGVVQDPRGPRLLLEPAQPVGVGGEGRRQDLDRDLAPQPRVPRPIDLAHPPRAERRESRRGPAGSRANHKSPITNGFSRAGDARESGSLIRGGKSRSPGRSRL